MRKPKQPHGKVTQLRSQSAANNNHQTSERGVPQMFQVSALKPPIHSLWAPKTDATKTKDESPAQIINENSNNYCCCIKSLIWGACNTAIYNWNMELNNNNLEFLAAMSMIWRKCINRRGKQCQAEIKGKKRDRVPMMIESPKSVLGIHPSSSASVAFPLTLGATYFSFLT